IAAETDYAQLLGSGGRRNCFLGPGPRIRSGSRSPPGLVLWRGIGLSINTGRWDVALLYVLQTQHAFHFGYRQLIDRIVSKGLAKSVVTPQAASLLGPCASLLHEALR